MNQNFENNVLEADIKRLSKEIAEKKSLLEHKNFSERDLIKKSLEPIIGQQSQAATKQVPKDDDKILNAGNQANYLEDSSLEIRLQVEKLIDNFFHRGIEKTIREAQKSGDFILDALHDSLTDKLYEEMKKRKLI